MSAEDVQAELNADLTSRMMEAALVPGLIIQLDRNWLGGQNLIRLLGPGPTPRSKPVDLIGYVIVGQEGATHADMLRELAIVLEQAGR